MSKTRPDRREPDGLPARFIGSADQVTVTTSQESAPTSTSPGQKRKPYVAIDSDDSFLDLPEPRYEGRSPEQSSQAIDRLLDPKARRAGNLGQLPKLPAPVDH